MATNKTIVKEVIQKQEDGALSDYYSLGADFESVIDTRAGKTTYSLAQFFDNYLDFTKNYQYVAYGSTQPTNPGAILWINTAKTNVQWYDTPGSPNK